MKMQSHVFIYVYLFNMYLNLVKNLRNMLLLTMPGQRSYTHLCAKFTVMAHNTQSKQRLVVASEEESSTL
jgi:hypothetical protein